MPNVIFNRRRLGFGAITGSVYYITSSCNVKIFLRGLYEGLSSLFTRIGTINMFIIASILLMRYTRFSGFVSASFNQLWIGAVVNCIFFSLKLITLFKLFISSARNIIRLRKLAIIEFKSNQATSSPEQAENKIELIRRMNNTCLICLGSLTKIDIEDKSNNIQDNGMVGFNCAKKSRSLLIDNSAQQMVLLNCGHVFHYKCFKKWFMGSGTCPYCRSKV